MSTDGHGLWASLPEEIALVIVKHVGLCCDLAEFFHRQRATDRIGRVSGYLFEDVLGYRRLNRAFAAVLWPVALCMVPMTQPHHAECFVEGVVRHAIEGMMATNRYAFLYGCVYDGCTRPGGAVRAPDQSENYYDQLAQKLEPMLQKLLGNRRLSHLEKRRAVSWMRYIFKYLDRCFVKRYELKPVRKLIAEAFGYQEEGEASPDDRPTSVRERHLRSLSESLHEDEDSSSSDDSSDEDEESSSEEEAAELQA